MGHPQHPLWLLLGVTPPTPPPVPSRFPPPIRTAAAATSNKEAKCSSSILSSLFLESNELNELNGCEGQQQQQGLNFYEPQKLSDGTLCLDDEKRKKLVLALLPLFSGRFIGKVTDIGSTRVSNSNCFNTAPGIL